MEEGRRPLRGLWVGCGNQYLPQMPSPRQHPVPETEFRPEQVRERRIRGEGGQIDPDKTKLLCKRVQQLTLAQSRVCSQAVPKACPAAHLPGECLGKLPCRKLVALTEDGSKRRCERFVIWQIIEKTGRGLFRTRRLNGHVSFTKVCLSLLKGKA